MWPFAIQSMVSQNRLPSQCIGLCHSYQYWTLYVCVCVCVCVKRVRIEHSKVRFRPQEITFCFVDCLI